MLKEDLLGPILHQQLTTGICKIRNTNLHIGDRNVLQGNIFRKSAAELRFPVVMTEH